MFDGHPAVCTNDVDRLAFYLFAVMASAGPSNPSHGATVGAEDIQDHDVSRFETRTTQNVRMLRAWAEDEERTVDVDRDHELLKPDIAPIGLVYAYEDGVKAPFAA